MERGTLKIGALRGGSVSEISQFLKDIELAYCALYEFEQRLTRWERQRRIWKRYVGPEELFFDSNSGYSNFFADGQRGPSGPEILPMYQLSIERVSIQSPGFWEFLGSLNPLQQMREYLNDRHKRRGDREFREIEERKRLELENELLARQVLEKENSVLRERLQILRESGVSQDEIEQVIWQQIGPPLSKLGTHQDTLLIEDARD